MTNKALHPKAPSDSLERRPRDEPGYRLIESKHVRPPYSRMQALANPMFLISARLQLNRIRRPASRPIPDAML